MSVGPDEDLVKVLLTKLRSKAWFWLFRQTELKRGLGHAREVTIESAVMKGSASGNFHGRPEPSPTSGWKKGTDNQDTQKYQW